MMTFMSEGEAGLPFRLASITRRQISTMAWSPRSFAASRTSQAASSGFSGFDSSVFAPGFLPKRWPAAPPNRIAFIADIPHPLSVRSRSEEHTSELQSHSDLVCRLLLEKKKKKHLDSNVYMYTRLISWM